MCAYNIVTNSAGVPYFPQASVNVTTEVVDFALGFRKIEPIGYFSVRLSNVIPTGTTGTLPITITLNGTSRNLTFPNGTNVTAADLVDVSFLTVFNDRFNSSLYLVSNIGV